MTRQWLAIVLAGLLGFALAPGLAAVAAQRNPTHPSYGPQDLWGAIAPPGPGWGFTPIVTDPGPTITVPPGDLVMLILRSADGLGHTFYVDYNGNNARDPPEPLSPLFGGAVPLPFNFTATTTPGTYSYLCDLHGPIMRGVFVVTGVNALPTIQLTNPDGVAQNRWTGGSLHRLTWVPNDPDDPPGFLSVWLNYTSSAGPGTIAGPIMGVPAFDWTVPPIDASDVRVLAEIYDPRGGKGTDNKLIPIIDSTPPTVTSHSPTDNAVGVPVNAPVTINFTEPMNTAVTEPAISFIPSVVPLSPTWSNGNRTVTVGHADFATRTTYAATVGTGARDASDPGNPLGGGVPFSWSFTTFDAPPVVSITAPVGGERWTGGTAHTISWTVSDPDDPPGALTCWLNLTGAGPPQPIGGPFPGSTISYSWATPTIDTETARVIVECVDPGSNRGSATSGMFAIDSTRPRVASTTPSQGAINVALNANVIVRFSESMNRTGTGRTAVIGLQAILAGAWVDLGLSWDAAGFNLTATPAGNLQPTIDYRLFVNGSALDVSDPGNAMGGGFTANFTTGVAVDNVRPTISNVVVTPPTNRTGGSIDIAATVTDNIGIASVSVDVLQPDSTRQNRTMTARPANRYGETSAWTQLGTYSFTIWAVDTSGNAASASGSFVITAVAGTTPPSIEHTPPSGAIRVGDAITLTATVTDPDDDLSFVKLVYTDTAGVPHNVSMTSQGNVYAVTIPAQTVAGAIRYWIYAEDSAGNRNATTPRTINVSAPTAPPTDYTALLIGLLVVGAVVVAALALLRRRRKGEEVRDPGEPPNPGT